MIKIIIQLSPFAAYLSIRHLQMLTKNMFVDNEGWNCIIVDLDSVQAKGFGEALHTLDNSKSWNIKSSGFSETTKSANEIYSTSKF
ncbi:hypothetical protein RclHR1_00940016 [Rhizophagus clarus]|nr:hypothetical protein RclHR1_00940016 [Rhizophagus clarus]